MSGVPIRLRVTAAFAVVMALVLAASGWFLYARLSSHLATQLRQELQVRAQDLSALVRGGGSLASDARSRLVEHGESYAQLVDQVKADFNTADYYQGAYLINQAVNELCPAQIWQLRQSAAGYTLPA